jgi:hypothetical protein
VADEDRSQPLPVREGCSGLGAEEEGQRGAVGVVAAGDGDGCESALGGPARPRVYDVGRAEASRFEKTLIDPRNKRCIHHCDDALRTQELFESFFAPLPLLEVVDE